MLKKSKKDSENFMDNVIMRYKKLALVNFEERHVMSIYNNLSKENKFELDVIYDVDAREELMSVVGDPFHFAVVSGDETLAVLGLQNTFGDEDENKAVLWCVFSENMRKHWISFVKCSPVLMDFLHRYYDEIIVETWIGNQKMCQWLAWLGFDARYVFENHFSNKMVHFVRCNYDTKHADDKISRPVLH